MQVRHAIDDGFDVRGFMYWTLIDNFEWNFAWVCITSSVLPTGIVCLLFGRQPVECRGT